MNAADIPFGTPLRIRNSNFQVPAVGYVDHPDAGLCSIIFVDDTSVLAFAGPTGVEVGFALAEATLEEVLFVDQVILDRFKGWLERLHDRIEELSNGKVRPTDASKLQ